MVRPVLEEMHVDVDERASAWAHVSRVKMSVQ